MKKLNKIKNKYRRNIHRLYQVYDSNGEVKDTIYLNIPKYIPFDQTEKYIKKRYEKAKKEMLMRMN